jgi:hypothetical protein
VDWAFESLGGPKSVLHAVNNTASWVNTTYTIDLCAPLKRINDVPDDQKCPGGTRCELLRYAVSTRWDLLTRNSVQYRARDQQGR